ncbi:MAG: hypothetical protein RL345_2375, partial [Chloroflexota bacterium]
HPVILWAGEGWHDVLQREGHRRMVKEFREFCVALEYKYRKPAVFMVRERVPMAWSTPVMQTAATGLVEELKSIAEQHGLWFTRCPPLWDALDRFMSQESGYYKPTAFNMTDPVEMAQAFAVWIRRAKALSSLLLDRRHTILAEKAVVLESEKRNGPPGKLGEYRAPSRDDPSLNDGGHGPASDSAQNSSLRPSEALQHIEKQFVMNAVAAGNETMTRYHGTTYDPTVAFGCVDVQITRDGRRGWIASTELPDEHCCARKPAPCGFHRSCLLCAAAKSERENKEAGWETQPFERRVVAIVTVMCEKICECRRAAIKNPKNLKDYYRSVLIFVKATGLRKTLSYFGGLIVDKSSVKRALQKSLILNLWKTSEQETTPSQDTMTYFLVAHDPGNQAYARWIKRLMKTSEENLGKTTEDIGDLVEAGIGILFLRDRWPNLRNAFAIDDPISVWRSIMRSFERYRPTPSDIQDAADDSRNKRKCLQTKDADKMLNKLGLWPEVERVEEVLKKNQLFPHSDQIITADDATDFVCINCSCALAQRRTDGAAGPRSVVLRHKNESSTSKDLFCTWCYDGIVGRQDEHYVMKEILYNHDIINEQIPWSPVDHSVLKTLQRARETGVDVGAHGAAPHSQASPMMVETHDCAHPIIVRGPDRQGQSVIIGFGGHRVINGVIQFGTSIEYAAEEHYRPVICSQCLRCLRTEKDLKCDCVKDTERKVNLLREKGLRNNVDPHEIGEMEDAITQYAKAQTRMVENTLLRATAWNQAIRMVQETRRLLQAQLDAEWQLSVGIKPPAAAGPDHAEERRKTGDAIPVSEVVAWIVAQTETKRAPFTATALTGYLMHHGTIVDPHVNDIDSFAARP